MKTSSPYHWVKHVEPELLMHDAFPLTGASPAFPWEDFAAHLAKNLELKHMLIKPSVVQWRVAKDIPEGFGSTAMPLHIAIPSFEGSLCWLMPEQEVIMLMTLLLTKETHPLDFQDPELINSFYRFTLLEALFHISQINFDKTINPCLTSKTEMPSFDALCLDVSITINDHTFWGRLAISKEFRQSWTERHLRHEPTPREVEIARQAEVVLHLEAGKTSLSFTQWKNAKAGDFILLDKCLVDPNRSDGRLLLTSNGRPVFLGELSEGHLTILEFSEYYEAESAMTNNRMDEPEDSHHEDEGLDFEDDFDDEDQSEEQSDFDFDEEIDDLEEFEDNEHETEEHEAELQHEHEIEHPQAKEDETIQKHPEPLKQQNGQTDTRTSISSSASSEATDKTPIAPKEIPVTLVIETGRIQMTVQKLLELEPGNMLELNTHPEDGVDLVINGKKVGKGELIYIGENLGVRILEVGTEN